MFVPLQDDNPLKRIKYQYVNVSLIVANVVVFLLSLAGSTDHVVASFAVIPGELFGFSAGGFPQSVQIPERLTLLTYMFFHGDIIHLAGNMLFLWVFGDNVEDALGHVKFLIFYLLCGIAGGLAHVFMTADPSAPLIGASAAIAGVVAAYLVLHPNVSVWVLVFRFFPLKIRAFWVLGAWVLMNVAFAILPVDPQVAWWAHVGGIVTGALLVLVMRRRGVPLFDERTSA